MKVLITGSTAQQCNPLMHERSPNFAGLLTTALTKFGAEVTWNDPDILPTTDSLSKYDSVIVGLASPLAIGSNRIYGALNTIDLLWDDPRLRLFLDAPEPDNITRGLRSVAMSPGSLTKEHFSGRKGYDNMIDPSVRVKSFQACNRLRTEKWPTTLVPAFPWMVEAQFEEVLPKGARGQIALTNLDRLLLREFGASYTEHTERESRWMAEKTVNRKWLRDLELEFPVVSLRANHRISVRKYMVDRLSTSAGFLHGPSKDKKVWWSPKVAIALSQKTPVFTDWRESRVLGKNWSLLPDIFEGLSNTEQKALGQQQYDTYSNAVPNAGITEHYLSRVLNLEEIDK